MRLAQLGERFVHLHIRVRGSSPIRSVHLLEGLLTCLLDSSFEIVRIDLFAERSKFGVNIAIGSAALLGLRQQLLEPKCSDCRVVIEFSEMSAAGFLDELALVGVDPRFIEEPLDLSVELNREFDADTRVFHGSTIVLRKRTSRGHRTWNVILLQETQ